MVNLVKEKEKLQTERKIYQDEYDAAKKMVQDAKSQGDLSENFEYVVAKETVKRDMNILFALDNTIELISNIIDQVEKEEVIYFTDTQVQLYSIVNYTVNESTFESLIADFSTEDLSIINKEAPIIKAIIGKSVGDTIVYNGNNVTINAVSKLGKENL